MSGPHLMAAVRAWPECGAGTRVPAGQRVLGVSTCSGLALTVSAPQSVGISWHWTSGAPTSGSSWSMWPQEACRSPARSTPSLSVWPRALDSRYPQPGAESGWGRAGVSPADLRCPSALRPHCGLHRGFPAEAGPGRAEPVAGFHLLLPVQAAQPRPGEGGKAGRSHP